MSEVKTIPIDIQGSEQDQLNREISWESSKEQLLDRTAMDLHSMGIWLRNMAADLLVEELPHEAHTVLSLFKTVEDHKINIELKRDLQTHRVESLKDKLDAEA